jgi:hypothetical protein
MTAAERQARFRATHANGMPRIKYRSPIDRRRRAQRWHAAVAELIALQDDYRTWLEALPQNLEASATAEALHAIWSTAYRARWRPLGKKHRVRLQASMPADVDRALRYAGGFAPARRPTPTDSDICKWQKQ